MTTLAHTAATPRLGHPRAHLRSYLAGVGATSALTSAALVAFLSLATFVAFNGVPFGGSSDAGGAAYLGSNASSAPTAAAAALGAAPGAVAKHLVADSTGVSAATTSGEAGYASGGSSGGGWNGSSGGS